MRLASGKERAKYEAFVRELFSQPDSHAITAHLADLRCPEPYRIRMKVLYSKVPLPDILLRPRTGSALQRLGGENHAFELTATVGREKKRSFNSTLACLPTGQLNVAAAVSVCTRDQWQATLGFLKRHYPAVIPIYLSQRELLQAVITLRRRGSYNWEFRVRGLSGREPINDALPHRTRSVREWTDQDLEGTLDLIAERRRTVSTVLLALHKRLAQRIDVAEAALCRITQQSEVDVNAMFALVWESVVHHLAEIGQAKLDRFANRGLRERNYQTASLAIQFRNPVLEDIEEVRRLVRVLEHYPSSMHAVDHGNPYANVRVTDRYDGSSFDVWAVNATSVILIPGLKATQAGVSRLVHHISNNFREGDVVEFGE